MYRVSSCRPLALAAGLLLLVGCEPGQNPDDRGERLVGQFEFDSPVDGSGPSSRDEDLAASAPNESADGPGEAPAPERLIEESDIWKLDGTTLYVLNRYRGLQVLDVSDLDAPKLVGRAPIYGWPREMYVRDGKAYVIVSDYYTYWRTADAASAPAGWHGSQVRIVDLSNPTRPVVEGGINVEGDVTDSRIVGDVMYLVSRRWAWYWRYDTQDTESRTVVLSIDVSDPANVRAVDSESFPMGHSGWEQHLYVNERAVYVATPEWSNSSSYTRIRYVDISDPAGAIVPRGEAVVPGRVQDRWAMDEYDGALRVASGQSWGNGDVYLTTWDATKPDTLPKLGGHTLRVDESLTAARFDGERGYLVSYRNIDPLFSFDLSDPTKPRLLGELEMTGWLDFMIPFGDRLVALGHEDVTTPQGGREVSLAVSLVDVSTDHPTLLSRVVLDGAWGWVPGDRDDFAKVFKVLPSENLVVFPYQAWSTTDWRYVGGVQLIDWQGDTLVKRGLVQDAGWVERAVPYENDTLFTIANELFQVLDIGDRDAPRVRGRVELARNVQQFAVLDDTHAVQLDGDWWRGDTRLTVTPLSDPDTGTPVSSLRVPAPYGRMWTHGKLAYVAGLRDGAGGESRTRVDVVDLSNPSTPKVRGSVKLPEQVHPGYRSWYWGWGDEAVQVGGSTLAFHRYTYNYWYEDCEGCGGGTRQPHRVHLVDLSDPDAPKVGATVSFADANWVWGLKAEGQTLYLSEYRLFERNGQQRARYFLRRVDVANPSKPVVHEPVNVPGYFVGASPDGRHVYTVETWWDRQAQVSMSRLYALELSGERAYLRGWVDLKGWLGSLHVDGTNVWASAQWSETVASEAGTRWVSHSQLVSVSFADPASPQVAGRAAMPVDYGWLLRVADGRAFVAGGPGLFTYDVSDAARPVFEGFHRTQGWVQDVVTKGSKAYLPTGYYGVQTLELGQ